MSRRGPNTAGAAWVLGTLSLVFLVTACRSKRVLLPRGEGAAVVVVPGEQSELPATTAPLAGELEPNNTLAQAQVFSVSLNQTEQGPSAVFVAGVLDAPADVDVFRFTLVPTEPTPAADDAAAAAPERATVSLVLLPQPPSEEAVRAEVLIGDPGVVLLRSNLDSNGLSVPNLPLQAGTDLLVRVARVKSKGALPTAYTLTAHLRQPGAAEEVEPNGTAAQATPLAAGTATVEAVGYLGWRQDTDWYVVDFASGLHDQALNLELQLPEGAAAEVGFGNAQGELLHGYARSATGTLTLANVLPAPDGKAWIRVQNSGAPNATGRYRLTVSASQRTPGLEQEPNNTTAYAQTWSGANFRGQIHPAGDEDVLRLCVPQGGAFELRPPDKLTLTATVLDAQLGAIYQPEVEAPLELKFPAATPPACYFIQIREKSGKRSNSLSFYQITVVP